jgi:S1-C subfamily serine protease
MPSEKLVVSPEEIELVKPETHAPPTSFQPPPPSIPLWVKFALSPLVLVLPVLCIVAIILRVAFRAQPPRMKHAWAAYLSTLLIISGILSTAATVLVYSFVPVPAIVNNGLPNLDERTDYPTLPSTLALTSAEASAQLKPLVIVVSPTVRLWNHQEVAAQSLGAGMLLHASKDGYLFATANHVANGKGIPSAPAPAHVMVALATGLWSTADVVASSPTLDLALLWIPRHSGTTTFVQPLATVEDGENVFVIGHPEGLKYTLSTGIVSGLRDQTLQISAAISPGNSGGPVYDDHGRLLGIVSSKFDSNADLNAENLGFATRASAFKNLADWTFQGNGKNLLNAYLQALPVTAPTPAPFVP